MKRDVDLIRELLLYMEMENKYNEDLSINSNKFPDTHSRVISAHLKEIRDRGWIRELSLASGGYMIVGGITPAGYDFLDSVRNPEIWKQTKEVGEKAGAWTLQLLGDLAKGLIKTKIEKHTGMEL